MLIGPTIVLSDLEEHLQDQLIKNQRELTKLKNELITLKTEASKTPQYVRNDEGQRVPNKHYDALIEEYQQKEQQYDELDSNTEFIKEKLEELETIEKDSGYKISKDKQKITLSLNDCLKLGYEVKGK